MSERTKEKAMTGITETEEMAISQDEGVIAVYDTMTAATDAVRKLGEAGVPFERISVLTQNLETQTTVHGFVSTGDVASTGAATGAGVGALFALLSGAAFFLVPGVGPLLAVGSFVPPLFGVMEGALGGAAFGGVVGAVMGHFVGNHHIPKLEEQLRAGKYLLVVHGDASVVDQARQVLAETGAVGVSTHDGGN
jgi:hypothetical protein